jgi:hypothetical protein
VRPDAPTPSPEQSFRNTLFLCGVTEPETVAAMWAVEKKRREDRAKQAAAKLRKR